MYGRSWPILPRLTMEITNNRLSKPPSSHNFISNVVLYFATPASEDKIRPVVVLKGRFGGAV